MLLEGEENAKAIKDRNLKIHVLEKMLDCVGIHLGVSLRVRVLVAVVEVGCLSARLHSYSRTSTHTRPHCTHRPSPLRSLLA